MYQFFTSTHNFYIGSLGGFVLGAIMGSISTAIITCRIMNNYFINLLDELVARIKQNME